MATEPSNEPAQIFNIQRLYVRDLSLETPKSPEIFRKPWNPQIEIELNAKTNNLADDVYEVQIAITATAKIETEVAFLVEVQQAGIFTIKGFTESEVHHKLGVHCPTILFPYARELVSDLVTRASFPPLFLAHVNFEELYAQRMAQAAKEESKQTQ